MSNLLKISIQLIMITLKLFTNIADTLNVKTDLEIVCSFLNGTQVGNASPPECTAIAIPTKNLDQLNAIKAIKGKLPLFLIDDTTYYNAWPDVADKGASAYLGDVKQLGVNYIAFDNTYKTTLKMNDERANFSNVFAKFFDDAKKLYPDVGFGLVITTDITFLKESFDIGVLNDHVDFFLLDSAQYRFCEHKNHQADMNVLATKDDITGSFAELKKLGADPSKFLYTIDLVVQSSKRSFLSVTYKDMSYSRLCSKKMSKHRKYCFNSIQNLVEKARLHITEKTLGIYVNGVNDDDIDGKCGCKTKDDSSTEFRGLKTIAGASREDKNDISYYDCTEGQFPVILH